MRRSKYIVYTDASYRADTDIGGWAFVSVLPVADGMFRYLAHASGLSPAGYSDSRKTDLLELYAIQRVIEWVAPVSDIEIITDNMNASRIINHDTSDVYEHMLELAKPISDKIEQLSVKKYLNVSATHIYRTSDIFALYADHLCRAKTKGSASRDFATFKKEGQEVMRYREENR